MRLIARSPRAPVPCSLCSAWTSGCLVHRLSHVYWEISHKGTASRGGWGQSGASSWEPPRADLGRGWGQAQAPRLQKSGLCKKTRIQKYKLFQQSHELPGLKALNTL